MTSEGKRHHPAIVPVSVDSSAMISTCRPLPEDIATLSEDDTGCQFCGVSYLLLSKYDKIVQHVSRLEKELETLKTYAVDHPILLSKMAQLEATHQHTLDHSNELEIELSQVKEDAGKAIRAQHELQLRYTRLTHDYETMSQRNKWMDDSLKSQIRSLVGSLSYSRDQISFLGQEIDAMKSEYKNASQKLMDSLTLDVEEQMYTKLRKIIEHESGIRVSSANARTNDVISSLKEQISDLKADQEESDKRYEQLLQEMNSTTEQYEEYLRSNKNISSEQSWNPRIVHCWQSKETLKTHYKRKKLKIRNR
ncbi:hypothetical protein BDR26DRAFT_449996 [Obelidium mucronatum]|nr:hypothetical protein BDR26DRAFT_449996 [Obelidium mucronatum]